MLDSFAKDIIRRIQRLTEEREAFRRDAERYRKIRRGQHWSVIDGLGDYLRGEALDASADASYEAGMEKTAGSA